MFGRSPWPEAGRIAAILRQETVGGVLLLAATVLALVWANSPWSHRYDQLRDARVGSSALHLQLTLGQWAADGLLAIFFFVAGLELKREFVAGDLRSPRRAAIPVVAAVSGVAVPALIYTLVNTGGGAARQGWAIPTATDIAFALAVLAVISSHLPSGLRTFLLTLAVVDDLLAITIIAVFYTASLSVVPLLLALVPLALFGLLVQRRVGSWYLLLPLAAVTWGLVHASGIHATVAGVLLAFTVPVLRSDRNGGPAAGPGMAEHFEHRMRPLSSGFAVPVFAFFSAGVTVGGFSGFADSMADRVTIGIVVALVVGKTIGIFGSTVLMARFTGAELDSELSWTDVLGIAILAGVGFTVSLLIGELAFGPDSAADDHVKVGVLVGSVLSAALAAIVLGRRNRTHRSRREAADGDHGPAASPDLLARATAVLAGAGVPTPEPDARALIARFGGDVADLWPAVERRAAREPLEYLTGVARFRSLELAVGPGVFVPRRESEVAVQLAVDELRRSASAQPVAVDLGTGSGAIALALATEVPAAFVWGVEVSPAAFDWAERNFRALAPRNARPLLADLSDALPELDAVVEVVVANPPYIPADATPRDPEVRLHSPEVALFGGPDGLDLVRAVSSTGRRLLRPGGLLVVEHGELQADDIAGLLRSDGWSDIHVSRDHLGRDRATAARARQDEA